MMNGLVLHLSGIFSFFRIPYTSLLMDTYPFPPKTTVIGMVGAAFGWKEEEFLENIKKFGYGVIIERSGEIVKEVARIFGNLRRDKERGIYYYEHKPVTKNMIYKPSYKVFLTSNEEDLINEATEKFYDPKYVLGLGDSEDLFYPEHPKFVKSMRIKEEKEAKKLRCILPSEIYRGYVKTLNTGEMVRGKNILLPREIKIPVDFVGRGKNRRFVSRNVFYYSGIELELKKPLEEVFDFDGEAVYLF
ncbi:MAG TPA: CRISPR-associated protein Cas5 [candidate division WOR-3 bacterium]|uniref:CRISPR-associated protein Cas5 n=1 Tax=candidate division WOR-3 bacterium TaxID=2052148 RepID=A0A7C5I4D8_UNCW3|nr:CRISPR-associated protein Cas5 [candidate division WOR-3 bacterium]